MVDIGRIHVTRGECLIIFGEMIFGETTFGTLTYHMSYVA